MLRFAIMLCGISYIFAMIPSCETKNFGGAVFEGIALHFGDVVAVIPGENETSYLRDSFPKNTSGCSLKIFDEERKPQILANLSRSIRVVEEVDFDLMLSIVQSCQQLQTQRVNYQQLPNNEGRPAPLPSKGDVSMWTLLKGILPGTKWCGVNDIATSYHDLGADFEVDKCCRAHDHCPVKVKAFSTNYGATNNHPYTKSHCSCDELFFKCLKRITSPGQAEKANSVGRVYFNILRLECGEPVYPKICLETIAHPQSRNDSQSTSETREPKKRFFLNNKPTEEKSRIPEKEVCIKWVEDREGIPNLFFRQQKNFFD